MVDKFNELYRSKVELISEVFLHLSEFSGGTFVIKVSGAILSDPNLAEDFFADIAMLKSCGLNIVLVHGGISIVNNMLSKFSLNSKVEEGKRISDQETAEFMEMVMSGYISKYIVAALNLIGANAVSISGKDANFFDAKRVKKRHNFNNSNIETIVDFGYFGEISSINPEILVNFEENEILPVISPIALGELGETFYVDSDELASMIATNIGASKLILISDHDGIKDEQGKYIKEASVENCHKIIDSKIISNNDVNKINCCLMAVEQLVAGAHIIDGRIPHSILLEVFSYDRIGTYIYSE